MPKKDQAIIESVYNLLDMVCAAQNKQTRKGKNKEDLAISATRLFKYNQSTLFLPVTLTIDHDALEILMGHSRVLTLRIIPSGAFEVAEELRQKITRNWPDIVVL
jgi:hypothetical protein